jgi:hypothetical protein
VKTGKKSAIAARANKTASSGDNDEGKKSKVVLDKKGDATSDVSGVGSFFDDARAPGSAVASEAASSGKLFAGKRGGAAAKADAKQKATLKRSRKEHDRAVAAAEAALRKSMRSAPGPDEDDDMDDDDDLLGNLPPPGVRNKKDVSASKNSAMKKSETETRKPPRFLDLIFLFF